MTAYEYGIRHKLFGAIYRAGLTASAARAWMSDDEWTTMNPWATFEVVRRPVDAWEVCATSVDEVSSLCAEAPAPADGDVP